MYSTWGMRVSFFELLAKRGALKNFDGHEDEQLARSMLDTAEVELDELERTLGSRVAADASNFRSKIEDQRKSLRTA